MLLIKFDSNYGDEFDVGGFIVMSEEDWEKHKSGVSKRFDALPKPLDDGHYHRDFELECYFGTNESMIWSSKEQYFADFKVSELSLADYRILKRLFGDRNGEIRSGMVVMLPIEGY